MAGPQLFSIQYFIGKKNTFIKFSVCVYVREREKANNVFKQHVNAFSLVSNIFTGCRYFFHLKRKILVVRKIFNQYSIQSKIISS